MVKQLILEEKDVNYLKSLATNSKCCAGIIAGQITSGQDFVAQLIRCPAQMVGEDLKQWNDFEDVDGSWVAGHAGQVLPCLPGGISVIGLFLTGKSTDTKQVMDKLKSLVYQAYKLVSKTEEAVNRYLQSKSDNVQPVFYTIFHVDSNTGAIVNSRQYDICDNKDSGRHVEIRQTDVQWDCLETSIHIDQTYLVSNSDKLQSTWQSCCQKISSAHLAIDGNYRQSTETLNPSSGGKASRKKKGTIKQPSSKTFHCQVFVPGFARVENHKAINSMQPLHVTGTIAAKAYAAPGSTVADATRYLKRDIVQSVYQRCEILSEDIRESESGENDEPRSFPRRVFAAEGDSGKIFFSEYLLPDEPVEDCLERYKDNLDMELDGSDLLEGNSKEVFGDPGIKPSSLSEPEKKSESVDSMMDLGNRTNVIVTLIATAVAMVAWILSPMLHGES